MSKYRAIAGIKDGHCVRPGRGAPLSADEREKEREWLASRALVRSSRGPEIYYDADGRKLIPVNLSQLNGDLRRPVWAWIEANRPKLAELIGAYCSKKIREVFDAEVVVFLPMGVCRELGVFG